MKLTVAVRLLFALGGPIVLAEKPHEVVTYPEHPENTLFDSTFHQNHQKNFSWSDPALQELLWEGFSEESRQGSQKTIDKRIAYVPKIFGPAIKLASCLACAVARYTRDIDYWSTQRFLDDMTVTREDTRNKCVFYGRRKAFIPAMSTLSVIAVNFAYNKCFTTIWHMWPRGLALMDPIPSDGLLDYYSMYKNGSHLQWIKEAGLLAQAAQKVDDDLITVYFSNMSRAVAITCVGQVYVMSDQPEFFQNGKSAGGIWWCTEWPKLRERFLSGLGEVAPTLIAVDTADYLRAFHVDWVTAETLTRAIIPRADLEMLRRAQEERQAQTGDSFQKRDTCPVAGENIPPQYEPSGTDFFG